MGRMNLNAGRMTRLAACWALAATAMILTACGGGGTASPAPGQINTPGFAQSLPWPPPESARHASATLTLNGSEFSSKNTSSSISGTQLLLIPEGNFAWAIYEFSAIPAAEIPASFTASLSLGGEMPDVFVGLADFETGAWEWHTAGSSFNQAVATGEHYLSETHKAYVAVASWGGSGAAVNSATVNTTASSLTPPANLAGAADVGQISLTWDAVAGATGYLVERDTQSSFATKTLLTTEPVAETSYVDSAVTGKVLYYYRAITVQGSTNSAPSGFVNVFSPQADLPAPQNVRGEEITSDSFRIAWDWPEASPYGFSIYISSAPDGPLHPSPESTPGFIRSFGVSGLSPGQIKYVRVIAKNSSGQFGRSSDEVAISTISPWEWSAPVTIGAGTGPLSACQTPSGAAVAYNGGSGITVAYNSGGGWNVDLAAAGVTAGYYIDIAAAGNGAVCVVMHVPDVDDCGGAVGTPGGSWQYKRIHGEGTTGQGHPRSGNSCRVAATDSEFAVVQYYISGQEWLLHVSPTSPVNWSTDTLLSGVIESTCDVQYKSGNPYAFFFDSDSAKLKVADLAGGWVFADALSSADDGVGESVRASLFGSEWWLTASNSDSQEVFSASGTQPPLGADRIGTWDEAGLFFTPVIEFGGKKAFCGVRSTVGWRFVLYDGFWNAMQLDVPGAELDENLGLVSLDGSPWVVFADPGDGMVKYSRGMPPT